MEELFPLALLVLTTLVLSIIALAKFSGLKASIDELKRRVLELESRGGTAPAKPASAPAAAPPPLPIYVTQPKVAAPASSRPVVAPIPHTPFNWESVLGVKLFAWIGGFAFFLGIVFFVKYAFENNWITPAMRIIAGAIVGALLIAVSLLPRIRTYRVPAQSLSATGMLILYADMYAAHAFYSLIPLTATIALMWIVTAGALALANYLASQTVSLLAVIGGFATPLLLSIGYTNPILFVVYISVLDCAVAAVVRLKGWSYLLSVASFLSIILLSAWTAGVFTDGDPTAPQINFLIIEGLFLGLCVAVTWQKELDVWTIIAMAIAGLGAVIVISVARIFYQNDLLLWLLLGNAGIIAFATVNRRFVGKEAALASLVALALLVTSFVEWLWCYDILQSWDGVKGLILNTDRATLDARAHLGLVIFRHVAIFLLYAAIPYLVGAKRLWPWMLAAVAAPIHFAFVYAYVDSPAHLVPHELFWLLPLAFALPAAFGVWYLLKKENVDLASGDSRLASQGAAVLAFVSLVFPVQLQREWITLGWAIEGLLLILLFRWIPNRRLRVASLIVFTGAFVRLAVNPAVFSYHPRTHTPIFNWYLYAYGTAAICLFLGARWFGEPREKLYELKASAFLYWMCGVVLFLLMNIEIADYFSIGPTLTFSFEGNFARDMTYTIAWSLFAFALVVLGIVRNVRNVRLVGIGLLCFAFAKLFLHDLDSLAQLYRIAALIAVAVIAIVASFVYQRFLLPKAKT